MALVLDSAIPTLSFDGGHGRTKAVFIGTKRKNVMSYGNFASLVAEIDANLYEMLADKDVRGLLSYQGKFYLTGDAVYEYKSGILKPRGQNRYTPNYYGILLMATLSGFFLPNNLPDVINVVASYPLDDRPYRKALSQLFIGKWQWQTPYGKYRVTVNECATWPESTGAVTNFSEIVNGKRNTFLDHSAKTPRVNGIIVDVGEETSQVGVLGKGGEIVVGKHVSIYDLGVRTVLQSIRSNFMASPKHVATLEGIVGGLNESDLIGILNERWFYNGGRDVNCNAIVESAINKLTNQLDTAITNLTGGRIQYVVRAGGGIVVLGKILDDMFEAKIKNASMHVQNVLPDDEIIYGTAKGNALGVLIAWDET